MLYLCVGVSTVTLTFIECRYVPTFPVKFDGMVLVLVGKELQNETYFVQI